MSFHALEISVSNQVATVWMNRPERHNAFDEILIRELTEAFANVGNDPALRVLVLAGRGKSFSAGADLDWMKRAAAATIETNRAEAQAMALMYRTLRELPKPTVARVHGAALGGGVGLTAACDIAVASTTATFATTEVRLGIIPAVISPYVISAIGARAAQRYFLTAEKFDAVEAHRLGLVHAVCEPDSLDSTVAALAETLAANAPLAQAAIKELIAAVADKPIDQTLIDETAERIATIRATPEAKEGLSAFFEKRSPRWTR